MHITVDLRQMDEFEKWLKRQPRRFKYVTAAVLNRYAFDVRKTATRRISKTMTIRNRGFVSRQIQVTKVIRGTPINSQFSIVGSVRKDRFSGWIEQEFGTKTKRNRFSTLAGRGGDDTKQMRHIIRLKPKHEVVTWDHPDYKPKGGERNVTGFFKMLERKKENRIVRVGSTFYKRKRSQFERVQVMKPVQPKRNKWMAHSLVTYKRRANLQTIFNQEYNRVIRPPRK